MDCAGAGWGRREDGPCPLPPPNFLCLPRDPGSYLCWEARRAGVPDAPRGPGLRMCRDRQRGSWGVGGEGAACQGTAAGKLAAWPVQQEGSQGPGPGSSGPLSPGRWLCKAGFALAPGQGCSYSRPQAQCCPSASRRAGQGRAQGLLAVPGAQRASVLLPPGNAAGWMPQPPHSRCSQLPP